MRSFAKDAVIAYAGAVFGAVLGVLSATALLRSVNRAWVDSDAFFDWLPGAVAVGMGIGMFLAMAIFKRAGSVIAAVTSVLVFGALSAVAYRYPDVGALILLSPVLALGLVRASEIRQRQALEKS